MHSNADDHEHPDIARVSKALAPLIGPITRTGLIRRNVHVLLSSDLQAAEPTVSAQQVSDVLAAAGRDGFDVSHVWYRVEGPLMESRPEDVGFDGSKLWFHGTTATLNFRAFKAGVRGVDELGVGMYFTDDASVAAAWAGRVGEGGRIVPVVLRKGEVFDLAKPVDYDALARRLRHRHPDVEVHREAAQIRAGKYVTEWSEQERAIINRAGQESWKAWLLESDAALASHIQESRRRAGGRWTAWLDRAGYVGAVNRNSQVPGQIVVFDPRNIRSPWARFNPAKSESPDLLHSLAEDAPWAQTQVTNRDGSAKVVFHGTTTRFDRFEVGMPAFNSWAFKDLPTRRAGLFFTESWDFAKKFARGQPEGRVIAAHLAVGSALDLTEGFQGLPAAHSDALRAAFLDVHDWAWMMSPRDIWQLFDDGAVGGPEFIAAVRAAGFDGVKMIESGPEGYPVEVWAVLDPSQVRVVNADAGSGEFLQSAPEVLGETRDASPAEEFVFHLTPASALEDVLARGIEPRIGERSLAAGELQPASYHFASVSALVDGLMGWAGDAFDANAELALVAVRREAAGLRVTPGAEYEERALAHIDPNALVLVSANVDAEVDLPRTIDAVLLGHEKTELGRRRPPASEFAAWIAGSAVVDEHGGPRVVYHGTTVWEHADRQLGDIQEFDRMASVRIVRRRASIDTVGTWFSTNPGEGGALMYSGGAGAVYPVYLNIKSPFVTTFDAMMAKARELAGLKKDEFVDGQAVEGLRAWLKENGHDGLRIIHDVARELQSTEFKNQDAWVALESSQIRFALGVRPATDEGGVLMPRVPESALASLASEGFERILREHRVAKARAMKAIGDVGDCAIVKNRAGDRWQMILRDASEPGKWRTQQFDARGFAGHRTFPSRAEAIDAVADAGYSIRDDEALDRMQNTPAFQRGLFVADLLRLVNGGAISFDEGSRRIELYDIQARTFASLGPSAAQAFFVPATGVMVMVADRIAQGHELAVFYHEVMHAHGRRTIGNAGWERLVGRVRSWTSSPIGSIERGIHDAALRRASRGAWGHGPAILDEELLAYAVEEAVLRGVRPCLEGPVGLAPEWLADVEATLRGAIFQACGGPAQELTSQQLVDLAYALAQLEHPVHGPALRERLEAMHPGAACHLAKLGGEFESATSMLRDTADAVDRPRGG